jgi:hypothetical protein
MGLQLLSERALAVHLKGGLHHLDGLVQLERPAAHNPFVDVPQPCTAKFCLFFGGFVSLISTQSKIGRDLFLSSVPILILGLWPLFSRS